MATAWVDERGPTLLYLARGMGRPMWVGESRDGVFFASTKLALEIVERYCELRLRKREVREGTLLTLEDGRIVGRERFRPDLDYVEDPPAAGRTCSAGARFLPDASRASPAAAGS